MTDMAEADATTDADASQTLAICAARAASDLKATDILILDVGTLLSITGYFVIASASNCACRISARPSPPAGLFVGETPIPGNCTK